MMLGAMGENPEPVNWYCCGDILFDVVVVQGKRYEGGKRQYTMSGREIGSRLII
jgi:hypothetical protein